MNITRHAAERWIERVNPNLDLEGAEKAIRKHDKIIALAISMGASAIKLGCGARLILAGSTIVTVSPKRIR